MQHVAEWGNLKARYARWWRKELDIPIIQLFINRDRDNTWDPWGLVHHLDDVDGTLKAHEAYRAGLSYELDAFPHFGVEFGPGIVASALGADVTVRPDTVWLRRNPPIEIGGAIRWDWNNDWYRRVLRVTEHVAEHAKGRFILGIPSHSGSLDLLAMLRHADQLLLDMRLEPRCVSEWMQSVTEFWLASFRRFHDAVATCQEGFSTPMPIWCPGSWYPVQADMAAMISPDDFERFVLPDITTIIGDLDHSIYHLDGPGQIPHVDLLLSIPGLDGIQWIPGAGEEGPASPKWYPLLRKIQDHGKLVVLLDIDAKEVPPLFDNIDPRNVLLTVTSHDPRDKDLLSAYL